MELGKTPEALKAALVCPVEWRGHLLNCSDCVYHGRGLAPCRIAVHEDAVNYINKLEAKVARRDELLKSMGVTISED